MKHLTSIVLVMTAFALTGCDPSFVDAQKDWDHAVQKAHQAYNDGNYDRVVNLLAKRSLDFERALSSEVNLGELGVIPVSEEESTYQDRIMRQMVRPIYQSAINSYANGHLLLVNALLKQGTHLRAKDVAARVLQPKSFLVVLKYEFHPNDPRYKTAGPKREVVESDTARLVASEFEQYLGRFYFFHPLTQDFKKVVNEN